MGTSYRVKVVVSPRKGHSSKTISFDKEVSAAKAVFVNLDAYDVINAQRLIDCDKWDWHECLLAACDATNGLIFAVYSVSDYGDVRFDYYASKEGFLYGEVPSPVFNAKLAKIHAAARLAKQAEVDQKIAKDKDMKIAALAKLSPDERKLLGLQ